MFYVNLPKLPNDIISAIKTQADRMGIEPDKYSGNKYKNGNYAYTEVQEFLHSKIISDLLLPKLNKPTISYVFVLRNKNNIPADFPPHFDAHRKFSLNYIVETGGNNVQTSFYDLQRSENDIELKPKNIPYENLIKTNKYVLSQNKWYLSNTQICHSVENIDSLRIILFILFEENESFESFKNNYSKLLTIIPNKEM
jgi:hypothetical protein